MDTSALLSKAYALRSSGNFTDAQKIYDDLLLEQPNNPLVNNAAGLLCALLENYAQAVEYFNKAVLHDPGFALAVCNLGNALNALGDVNGAIGAFKKAIALDRNLFEAYYNMGNALRQSHNFDEAILCYKAALHVKPNSPEALTNIGEALQTIGNFSQAEQYYRTLLAPSKTNVLAFSNLLICMNYNPANSPQKLFEEHADFGKLFPPPTMLHEKTIFPHEKKKLRIGYVSPDFCMHPVSRFIEPIFMSHDKNAFEIYCYADVAKPDAITENLRQCCTKWQSVLKKSDGEVARLIRQDEIDILVDLSGHTAHNRLTVFAQKPAPLQVSYLGYPNTSGLSAMDYYLTDATIDPAGHDRFYTEKLFRLENCFCTFLPYHNAPMVNDLPAQKSGYLTFGSLHTLTRLNEQVIGLWSELLLQLPDSRLRIIRNTLVGGVRKRLYGEFEKRGISPGRIDMCNELPSAGHLAFYHDIDILLDTFPWSGHTTACESLWMGVPVITLLGDRHASRMVASVLRAVGLEEFIAHSNDDYISIAIKAAGQLEKLSDLRQGLRNRMQASDLCDAAEFTKGLESAFRRMWDMERIK